MSKAVKKPKVQAKPRRPISRAINHKPEKRHGRRLPDERLEVADQEELASLGDSLASSDPNFQSELTYDGYRSIEESDNDSYNSRDLERNDQATHELNVEDREEDPKSGEENVIDPQENRK